MSDFKPYRAVAAEADLHAVVRQCNQRCWLLTSPQRLTGPLAEYAVLLLALKMEPRLELAPLRQLPEPLAAGRIRVMLRHDIDHDLPCAAAMCLLEQALGVPASYYIHHASAYYYGTFDDDGVMHRNEAAAELYHRIQQSGAEVGLHLDPWGVYQRGVDGAEAVTTELAWLRGQGLSIRGTTAHGSAPYYGAENFEIFRERKLRPAGSIRLAGRDVPLGSLSERQLGLDYEGNFASAAAGASAEDLDRYLATPAETDPLEHLRLYLHANPHVRWGCDCTFWLRGHNRWALAAADPQGLWRPAASTHEMLQALRELPGGTRVVLHVHPCYYGLRIAPDRDPVGWQESLLGRQMADVPLLDVLGMRSNVVHLMFEAARAGDVAARVETALASLGERMAVLETCLADMDLKLNRTKDILEAARGRRLGKYIF